MVVYNISTSESEYINGIVSNYRNTHQLQLSSISRYIYLSRSQVRDRITFQSLKIFILFLPFFIRSNFLQIFHVKLQ